MNRIFKFISLNDRGLLKMFKHWPVAWQGECLCLCVCVPWSIFRHNSHGSSSPEVRNIVDISQGKVQNFLGNEGTLHHRLTKKYSDCVKKSEYIKECWFGLRGLRGFLNLFLCFTRRSLNNTEINAFLKRNLTITDLENSSKTFFITSTQNAIPYPRRFTPPCSHTHSFPIWFLFGLCSINNNHNYIVPSDPSLT